MRILKNGFIIAILCCGMYYSCLAQNKHVLHSVQTKKPFSSAKSEDIFRITISGKDTLNGTITFQILTNKNKKIFVEKFSSDALIGFGLPDDDGSRIITPKEYSDYIIERMNSFFNADNFITPAIAANEEYNPDYCKKALWKEIKGDKSSIGFHYLLGKEDNRYIVFSKKKNKVVLYKTHD